MNLHTVVINLTNMRLIPYNPAKYQRKSQRFSADRAKLFLNFALILHTRGMRFLPCFEQRPILDRDVIGSSWEMTRGRAGEVALWLGTDIQTVSFYSDGTVFFSCGRKCLSEACSKIHRKRCAGR